MLDRNISVTGKRLWIAFRFCIFVLWTQSILRQSPCRSCCELLSDFVSSFFEHNFDALLPFCMMLWIAFRFCIFVLWTQLSVSNSGTTSCCELLSDFVSSFFEHNELRILKWPCWVVNCFQILYLRSLNTILYFMGSRKGQLWIAFRFCIFVLWTQSISIGRIFSVSCELLSDFVSSFFEHNRPGPPWCGRQVVNCFQILYLRSLNTINFVNWLSSR